MSACFTYDTTNRNFSLLFSGNFMSAFGISFCCYSGNAWITTFPICCWWMNTFISWTNPNAFPFFIDLISYFEFTYFMLLSQFNPNHQERYDIQLLIFLHHNTRLHILLPGPIIKKNIWFIIIKIYIYWFLIISMI